MKLPSQNRRVPKPKTTKTLDRNQIRAGTIHPLNFHHPLRTQIHQKPFSDHTYEAPCRKRTIYAGPATQKIKILAHWVDSHIIWDSTQWARILIFLARGSTKIPPFDETHVDLHMFFLRRIENWEDREHYARFCAYFCVLCRHESQIQWCVDWYKVYYSYSCHFDLNARRSVLASRYLPL